MPFFIARVTGTDSVVVRVDRHEFESEDAAEAVAQTRYPDGRYLVVEAAHTGAAAHLADRQVAQADFQWLRTSRPPARPTG